jgi:hypothetical protein
MLNDEDRLVLGTEHCSSQVFASMAKVHCLENLIDIEQLPSLQRQFWDALNDFDKAKTLVLEQVRVARFEHVGEQFIALGAPGCADQHLRMVFAHDIKRVSRRQEPSFGNSPIPQLHAILQLLQDHRGLVKSLLADCPVTYQIVEQDDRAQIVDLESNRDTIWIDGQEFPRSEIYRWEFGNSRETEEATRFRQMLLNLGYGGSTTCGAQLWKIEGRPVSIGASGKGRLYIPNKGMSYLYLHLPPGEAGDFAFWVFTSSGSSIVCYSIRIEADAKGKLTFSKFAPEVIVCELQQFVGEKVLISRPLTADEQRNFD